MEELTGNKLGCMEDNLKEFLIKYYRTLKFRDEAKKTLQRFQPDVNCSASFCELRTETIYHLFDQNINSRIRVISNSSLFHY